MIPTSVSPATRSAAERTVFKALAGAEIPGTAFHSLLLSWHEYKPGSEADFVILNRRGVLVLEVKGGGVSSGPDGYWRYTGRDGRAHQSREGPFRQAESAMRSLRTRLAELVGAYEVSCLAFGWGVVLPDCNFDIVSVEWDDELVYDAERARTEPVRAFVEKVQTHWLRVLDRRPASVETVNRVGSAMRPLFHRVPSLRSRADALDLEVERLTKEQATRLEIIETSPRIVCSGGAGTGKTFLALEIARQHAGAGLSVLYTCSNPVLAAFVRSRPLMEGVDVLALQELPSGGRRWDVLVVDEAQDLLDLDGLAQLSQLVAGGLERGTWRFFLDPNAQAALMGRFDPEALDLLVEAGAVSAVLTMNCRNTEDIVGQTQMLTGADLGTPTLGRGPGVAIEVYDDPEDEARRLAAHLRSLSDSDVDPGAVTILSGVPRVLSCVSRLPDGAEIPEVAEVVPTGWPSKVTTFSTVEDFKGLENGFVCVVDLPIDSSSVQDVSRLYVALSRARTALWLCVGREAEKAMKEMARRHIRMTATAPKEGGDGPGR